MKLPARFCWHAHAAITQDPGGQGVGPEVTQQGSVIAKVPNPVGGGGAKNLAVIRDGHPAPSDTDPPGSSTQFDTFDISTPVDSRTEDWIGYQYLGPVTFSRVVFQEGMEFTDGGWFTSLTVQVRQGVIWHNVSSLVVAPPYQPNNHRGFDTYQLDFAPITGDAIRIYGPPGGEARFISVAELRVWAAAGTGGAPTTPALGNDITASATPVAKITGPLGVGNKDLSIIQQALIDEGAAAALSFQSQYDTYTGDVYRTEDWIGYKFPDQRFFGHMVLQSGFNFPDGGWWDSVSVQVRQNGHWVGVSDLAFRPSYSAGGGGAPFARYQVDFVPIGGDGIRVIGRPGGTAHFVAVASLHVYDGNPCAGKADGTACSDGDGCTVGDRCLAGTCTPVGPYDCGVPDPCHKAGVCQRETGLCTREIEADHTQCDDGNRCTVGDECNLGTCVPGQPTACVGTDKQYAVLTNLGSFQGQSVAMDINNNGLVIGNDTPGHDSSTAGWRPGPIQSSIFRWSAQTLGPVTYDTPVGPDNFAMGMNSFGSVAGVGGPELNWRWANILFSGGPGEIPVLLGTGQAVGINDNNQITGSGYFPNTAGVTIFRRTGDQLELLTDPKFPGDAYAHAIASDGTIVGYGVTAQGSTAALMSDDHNGLIDLNDLVALNQPADAQDHWDLIEATSIWVDEETGKKTILGWGTNNSVPHGFSLTLNPQGGWYLVDLKSLAPFDQPTSYVHLPIPQKMNAHGEIVGAFWDRHENWPHDAFVWTPELGRIENLNDFVDPASGWYLIAAFGINDNHDVVGFGSLHGQMRAFVMRLPDRSLCEAVDRCHAPPARDPLTGKCETSSAPVADGTSCYDGGRCANNNVCVAGVCGGTTTVCLRVDGVVDAGNGKLKAIFGYENQDEFTSTPTPNEVLIDGYPLSDPLPAPPRTFASSSIHPGAYQPVFDGDKTISWRVGGQKVSAGGYMGLSTPTTMANGDQTLTIDGVSVTVAVNTARFQNAPPDITPTSGPPHGGAFNGALSGTLDVLPTGAATYSIPIKVPPGIAGVAPALHLSYNSQSGNSIAGQGWDLGGLSAIHRCPKTRILDGEARAVQMDTDGGVDGICLDGKRLYKDTTQSKETYFTEAVDFSTITRDPDSHGFIVETKAGERRFYGARLDGLVHFDQSQPSDPGDALIAIWPLTKVVDAWGNFMDFRYNEDKSDFAAEGLMISRIDYTGHVPSVGRGSRDSRAVAPFYSVNFGYEVRTDVRTTRFGSFAIPRRKRLKSITVTNYGEMSDLSSYALSYVDPATDSKADRLMLPSRLAGVHYCARLEVGGTQQCLRDATFDWDGGGYTWAKAPEYALPAPIDRFWNTDNSTWESHGTQFIDLNGDGRLDFIQARWTNDRSLNKAWENTGKGWAERPEWALPLPLVDANGVARDNQLADFDGDGVLDFISTRNYQCIGGGTVRDGDVSCTSSDPAMGLCHFEGTSCVGDPNNPPISPAVWLNRIRLNQGWVIAPQFSQLPAVGGWQPLALAGRKQIVDKIIDINGDGKPDIFRMDFELSHNSTRVAYGTGNGWVNSPENYTPSHKPNMLGSFADLIYLHFDDVNRDGLPDMITQQPVGAFPVLPFVVGINTGNNSADDDYSVWHVRKYTSLAPSDDPAADVQRGDVDGDGILDVVAGGAVRYGLVGSCDPQVDDACSCEEQTDGSQRCTAFENVWPTTTVRLSTGTALTTQGAGQYLASLTNARDLKAKQATLPLFDYGFALADLNADGLVDVVSGHHDGGQALINTGVDWRDIYGETKYQTSAGPDPVRFVPNATPAGAPSGNSFVDLDGDGVTDVVHASAYGTPLQTEAWLNKYRPPVIKNFPNGLAEKSVVSYRTITTAAAKEAGTYTDDGGLDPGTTLLTLPMRVVANVQREDGKAIGQMATTTYQYSSMRTSAYERGPQGFKTVTVTDPSNVKTTTTYSQIYPYTGMPISVEKVRLSVPRVNRFTTFPINEDLPLTTTTTIYCDSPEENGPCADAQGPLAGKKYPPMAKVFVRPKTVTDVSRLYFDATTTDPTSPSPIAATAPETVTTATSFQYDDKGNPHVVSVGTERSSGGKYLKTTESTFGAVDSRERREGKATEVTVTTINLTPGAHLNETVTHTTDFAYDVVNEYVVGQTSYSTFALVKTIVEPKAPASENVTLHTVLEYDRFGNIQTTTRCGTDFDNCAPGATGPADLPFRTTSVRYTVANFNFPTGGSGLIPSPSYGDGRFPVQTINAEGHKEYAAYNPVTGSVLQRTDANGIHACLGYDALGRSRTETARCGTGQALTTTTDFFEPEFGTEETRGFVTVIRSPTGATSWTMTDALGRTKETFAIGFDGRLVQAGTTIYDELGRPQVETKARFDSPDEETFSTTRVFDKFNRVVSVTQELGDVDDAKPNALSVVATRYEGSRTVTRHFEGGVETHKRTESKNALGKVDEITDAKGGKVSFLYDPEGDLVQTTDDKKNVVQIVYDRLKRKTATIDPDMGTWNYSYNPFGEIVTQNDPKHSTPVTSTYDRLGRVTSRTDSDGASQWVFDIAPGKGIGKLAASAGPVDDRLDDVCTPPAAYTTITPGKRSLRWVQYSDVGEPSETFECTDGTTFNTSYEYLLGRLSVMRYPQVGEGRLTVSYHYNAAGYLHYLMDDGAGRLLWAAEEANAAGQITKELTANGVETVADRNPSTGWLRGSDSVSRFENDRLVQSWRFGFDELGNLASRQRLGQINVARSDETFIYDELDRLKSATTAVTGMGSTTDTFDYDSLGNLTSKGGKQYSYSGCGAGPHAVCTVEDSAAFSYDANGNFQQGGGRTATYNAKNKATLITGNNAFVEFVYGAGGDRVVQLAGTAAGDPLAARTVYVGLDGTGKSTYERTTRQGAVEHVQFIYAGSVHAGNAFAVRVVDGSGSTATKYNHFDHLGSVTAQSDEIGHVADAVTSGSKTEILGYDAWGARRSPEGGVVDPTTLFSPAGHREFTSHETIPNVGLVNMNGRIYDPVVGRFLSPDPNVQFVADLQGYNRYAYVQNNPLRYTDPTGYFIDSGFDFFVNITIGVAALAVCGPAAGVCAVGFAAAATAYNTASAINAGAPWDQAVAIGVIGLGAGISLGQIGGFAGSKVGGFSGAVIGGAIGGAASGAMMSPISGKGLGLSVLEGAAQGAVWAAIGYAVHAGAPVTQTSAAAQGGGGTNGFIFAADGPPGTASDGDGGVYEVPYDNADGGRDTSPAAGRPGYAEKAREVVLQLLCLWGCSRAPNIDALMGTLLPYVPNPQHDPLSPNFNPRKTLEPSDAGDVYRRSLADPKKPGVRWGYSDLMKEIYRFASKNADSAHFNGATGFGPEPLPAQSVPVEFRRLWGFRSK